MRRLAVFALLATGMAACAAITGVSDLTTSDALDAEVPDATQPDDSGGSADRVNPAISLDGSLEGDGGDAGDAEILSPGTIDLVKCGSKSCEAGVDMCCFSFLASGTCTPANSSCSAGAYSIRCDDATDCPANQDCCASGTSMAITSTECAERAACAASARKIACAVSAQCPSGLRCKTFGLLQSLKVCQ